MSSWMECKLGEIATYRTGKLNSNAATENGEYPFFTCSPITAKIDNFAFNEEALLLAGNNANGIFSLKYYKGKFNAYQRTYIINTEEDYKFLFYSLKLQLANLMHMSQGTATKFLTLPILNSIDISLPPLEEQKAIAEVLSSLDDKIDLLHRQNQTLESLAQTLFRQWFIEEAKEEWEEKPLSKIADFLNGLACQKFPPQNDIEKLPVLKIKDLKDGISENSDYATSDVKPEYIVNNGDVIFAWSASLMVKIWDGEQCVLNQHLFKVTSKDFPKWFYYHWCKYHLDNFIAISSAHATTMGHIKRGDLDEAMCVIPSNEELVKMDDEISPIFEKIETNSRQIKSLEKMRDTLVPKLLSGEVRVKN
ncbi:MAG: restriction endonuclease subunit S [Sulfurimonadaceae bacterium]